MGINQAIVQYFLAFPIWQWAGKGAVPRYDRAPQSRKVLAVHKRGRGAVVVSEST
jgi:hypothetical protein